LALSGLRVGAAEGCEGGGRFAAFGSSYRKSCTPFIPWGRVHLRMQRINQRIQHGKFTQSGRLSGRRAFDFDLGRPVKPRWPEADIEAAGEPAWMPV